MDWNDSRQRTGETVSGRKNHESVPVWQREEGVCQLHQSPEFPATKYPYLSDRNPVVRALRI